MSLSFFYALTSPKLLLSRSASNCTVGMDLQFRSVQGRGDFFTVNQTLNKTGYISHERLKRIHLKPVRSRSHAPKNSPKVSILFHSQMISSFSACMYCSVNCNWILITGIDRKKGLNVVFAVSWWVGPLTNNIMLISSIYSMIFRGRFKEAA